MTAPDAPTNRSYGFGSTIGLTLSHRAGRVPLPVSGRANAVAECAPVLVSEEQLYLFPPLSFIGASGGYVGGVV